MRKRKPNRLTVREKIGMLILGAGLIIVVTVATWATILWINRPVPSQVVALPTQTPVLVWPTLTSTPNRDLPIDAHFILTAANGDLLSNENTVQFQVLAIKGDNVAVAPGSHTLAYVRDGNLYINRAGNEQYINAPGQVRFPAWSADGNYLAFVSHDIGDTVYRFAIDSLDESGHVDLTQVLALTDTSISITVPPRSIPGGNKLLIVEKQGPSQTAFYSFDLDCNGCADQLDLLGHQLVQFNVTWADYDPAQKFVAFSDDHDQLYLLYPDNGQISPILHDYIPKHCPEFSSDGKWLAYVTTDHLDVANVADVLTSTDTIRFATLGSDVTCLEWLK